MKKSLQTFLQVPITKHNFNHNTKYFQNYTHYLLRLNFKLSYPQLIYKMCRFTTKSKNYLHFSPKIKITSFSKYLFFLYYKKSKLKIYQIILISALCTSNLQWLASTQLISKQNFINLQSAYIHQLNIFMKLFSSHIELIIF